MMIGADRERDCNTVLDTTGIIEVQGHDSEDGLVVERFNKGYLKLANNWSSPLVFYFSLVSYWHGDVGSGNTERQLTAYHPSLDSTHVGRFVFCIILLYREVKMERQKGNVRLYSADAETTLGH